ncbi:MAG TPA: hypothetical protein VKW06_01535 [Candidatus Angelobacter sp.]|nr:hypothetical protein [Candidatus Angelobacter sp.]
MNRNRIATCASALLLAGMAAAQAPEGPQKETAEAAPNALQPIVRYDNQQMKLLVAGKLAASHVTVRDWEIHGKQKVAKFPETGMLIVQLQSGTVTTNIAGKEEKRRPGDFWTVPAGTTMALQVTSESAGLHVVSVSKR